MLAEVSENGLVLLQSQELSDHFWSQDFAIFQRRLWTSLAEGFALQLIVNETKSGNDECGNIHGGDLLKNVWYGDFTFSVISILCQGSRKTCIPG
jgi:hypothetical protein